MKKLKRINEKILLHPIMTFIFLTGLLILVSGILDFFDASVTYNKINVKTGGYESSLVTVESLMNLSGIKYIFSNTVSNFVGFTPLSMLLIVLIGIGIMDKSGLLDTLFFVFTKKSSKRTVTYILSLLCILTSITGDLCFIVFIPLSALLFKYGKRNPLIGIISSFAALSLGYGMNIAFSSIDSAMVNYTELAANIVTANYSISSLCYVFIMFIAIIIGSAIITYVTEKIIAPSIGKYEIEESEIIQDKEKLTKREIRGLLLSGTGALAYILVFIYNIIPNIPFGGNFLDYSQARYIDKLFGYDSFFNSGFVFVITMFFFVVGLLYAFGTSQVKNHRDVCNYLSHSLDGIGKVIVMLFFASTFISLLKYTNIGSLLTALLSNLVSSSGFTGMPLIFLVIFVTIISSFLMPSFVNRWMIFSGTLVPAMMTAGYSPEFAQLVFTASSTSVYAITPAMAYFVIYIAYMEKYNKDGIGFVKGISYMMPYCIGILIMWIVLLILWMLVGIPMGINSLPLM